METGFSSVVTMSRGTLDPSDCPHSTDMFNSTSDTLTPAEPATRNMVLLLPLLLLVSCTIVANIVVMVCTRINKRLRTVSSLYVLSLSGADAIVGMTVMTGMLVFTLYGYWPFGATLCTVWVGLDFTCCTVSMVHLCLIAHDRYVAVVHPLEYKMKRTANDALIRIIMAWLGSMIVWLPAIIAIRITNADISADTDCLFMPDNLYILIQSIVVYYGPIIVMVFFYMMCLHKLHLRYLKTADAARNAGNHVFGQESTYIPEPTISYTNPTTRQSGHMAGHNLRPDEHDAQIVISQTKMSKQQMQLRSIRTLGVVIVMFLICWLPFCLFWPITAYCPDCVPAKAYEYSYWSAYLNSTINPFLYFLTNRDFRHAFKQLVTCRKKRNSVTPHVITVRQ